MTTPAKNPAGRPRKATKRPPKEAAKLLKQRDEMAARFYKEATIMPMIGRWAASEALADLLIQQRVMVEARVKGELGADEGRTLTSLAGTIIKLYDRLKLNQGEVDTLEEDEL